MPMLPRRQSIALSYCRQHLAPGAHADPVRHVPAIRFAGATSVIGRPTLATISMRQCSLRRDGLSRGLLCCKAFSDEGAAVRHPVNKR